ncbi:MAG TPA: hypothetical protein VFS43_46100 [Polyangiaceae bacterium]|nr:hypothetical protein [Polyangiaceae bacterium]
MIRREFGLRLALVVALGAGLAGCGDAADGGAAGAGGAAGGAGAGAGNAPGSGGGPGAGGAPGFRPGGTPPVKLADVQAFLAAGAYLPENDDNWLCGEVGQIVVGISPHTNSDGTADARICATKSVVDDSNFVTDGPNKGWPVGIAAVKEIYDDPDDRTALTRYAYYTKTNDAWYWYEAAPGAPARAVQAGLSLEPCQSCHRNDELEFVRRANEIDGEGPDGAASP